MHELIERIVGLAANIDTCVCVGVGGCALVDELSALRPGRLVLLEGNEEAAAQIASQLPHWPSAELHTVVVAPTAGIVTWYTHNLPAFDGPIDAAPLTRFFPRLVRTGETRRQAVGIGEWLASLNLEPNETGSINVLVLALPGQELNLLHGISAELLECFDAVVVQGCSDAAYAGDSTLPALARRLEDRGFVPGEVSSQRPLWPALVARLDRARWRAVKLEWRVRELEAVVLAQQATHREQTEALGRSLDAAERLAIELRARAEQAEQSCLMAEQQAQKSLQQLDETVRLKQAAEHSVREVSLQLERLSESSAATESRQREHEAKLQELMLVADAARTAADDAEARLRLAVLAREECEGATRVLEARLAQAIDEKQLAERIAIERQSQRYSLVQAKTQAEQALTEVRIELERALATNAVTQQVLIERQELLDAAIADKLAARSELEQMAALRHELEAQIDRLHEELAQTRTAHQGAEDLALELGRELKEAIRHRNECANEAATLREQLEQAHGLLDEERAAARQRAAEAGAQRLCIIQLEAELRDNRRALNVAVRTQALREHDLRELQERYAKIQREQDASQELVTRLAERLTVAQRYFDQLTAEASSSAPSIPIAASPAGATRSVRTRKKSMVTVIASPQTKRPSVQASAALDVSDPPVPDVAAADPAPAPAPRSETAPARRRRGKKATTSTTG
jgi:hypothetical protein